MLIVALVLAVISLAALVTAVVTSNELIAWACIGFSALGVLLLVVDAIRDRNRRPVAAAAVEEASDDEDLGEDVEDVEDVEGVEDEAIDDEETEVDVEDYPDEVVYDDPDHDEPSDDEPDYPVAAEEAAIHIVSDADEQSYIVTESTTVSHADTSADDSVVVIYSSEIESGDLEDSEEERGER